MFGVKGRRDRNIIYQTIDKLNDGEEIFATANQVDCPTTYTKDIAEALLEIVKFRFYGRYYLANEGMTSRYNFRLEITRRFGLETKKTIPYTSVERIAPRPRKCVCVLKCKLVQEVFGIKFDDWKIALKRCLNEANKKGRKLE